MAPSITTIDPQTHIVAPKPSATRNTSPTKTVMPENIVSIGTVTTIPTPSGVSGVAQPKQTANTRLFSEKKESDPDVYFDGPDIRQSGQAQPASDPEQKGNIPGSPHSTAAVPPTNDPPPEPSESLVSAAGHIMLLDPSRSRVDDPKLDHTGAPSIDWGRVALGDKTFHIPAQVYDTSVAAHAISPLSEAVSIDAITLLPDATLMTVSSRLISIDSLNRIAFGSQSDRLPETVPVLTITLSNGAARVLLSNEFLVYHATSMAAADAVAVSETRVSLNTLSDLISRDTPDALRTTTPSINRVHDSQAATKSGEAIQSQSDRVPTASLNLTPSAIPDPVFRTPVSSQPSALPSGARSIPFASQSPGVLVTTNPSRLGTAHPKTVNVAGFNSTSKAPGKTVNTFKGNAERRRRSAVWGTISLLTTLMIVLVFID